MAWLERVAVRAFSSQLQIPPYRRTYPSGRARKRAALRPSCRYFVEHRAWFRARNTTARMVSTVLDTRPREGRQRGSLDGYITKHLVDCLQRVRGQFDT
jgi:hypothetical protein